MLIVLKAAFTYVSCVFRKKILKLPVGAKTSILPIIVIHKKNTFTNALDPLSSKMQLRIIKESFKQSGKILLNDIIGKK